MKLLVHKNKLGSVILALPVTVSSYKLGTIFQPTLFIFPIPHLGLKGRLLPTRQAKVLRVKCRGPLTSCSFTPGMTSRSDPLLGESRSTWKSTCPSGPWDQLTRTGGQSSRAKFTTIRALPICFFFPKIGISRVFL